LIIMPNRNSKAGHQPLRTCVVCKKKIDQSVLLNFFIMRESVVFDTKRQIQTRKRYLCDEAVCKNGFEQWFKRFAKKAFGRKVTRG